MVTWSLPVASTHWEESRKHPKTGRTKSWGANKNSRPSEHVSNVRAAHPYRRVQDMHHIGLSNEEESDLLSRTFSSRPFGQPHRWEHQRIKLRKLKLDKIGKGLYHDGQPGHGERM